MRDHLTAVLAREILGPRNGPFERIVGRDDNPPPDPSDEYVVGVLEPRGFTRGIFAYFGRPQLAQTVARMDHAEEADEDEDNDSGTGPMEINPELDPRALAKSVGLSFVVANGREARISVCTTWARYGRDSNSWQRTPHFLIRRQVGLQKDDSWTSEQDSGVRLYLRRIIVREGVHVSVYLVNETPLSDRRPRVEELVFQPQIRVVCENSTRLVAIRGEQEGESDPQGLAFLYQNRYAMARGHLCGALWREVDPERPSSVSRVEEDGPPFSWVDGQILSAEDRRYFTCPNARTDYLPTYGVEQASFSGPQTEHLEELAPELLADMWQPEDLFRTLRPILDAFERWIVATRQAADSNTLEQYREVASRNIAACERSLNRMREGLNLLREDSDVRLSFCFMNKAMHQQSTWRDPNNPLRWRLFQIAFILQCISGIAQDQHQDRRLCDLLWFPTGAGKTEAYLGLAAFAIALRRRIAKRNKRSDLQAGMAVISRYTLRLLTIQQFRRALAMITACEYFRCLGWLPRGHVKEDLSWGTSRFSIGLWVGAGVTPNRLINFQGYDRVRNRRVLYLGAVGELEGRRRWRASSAIHVEGEESEPAQVLNCPACRSILAVSPTTLVPGRHEIHWIISCRGRLATPDLTRLRQYHGLTARTITITPLPNGRSNVLSVELEVAPRSEISPDIVDAWWDEIIKPAIDESCEEEFARPSRPGYFFRRSGLTQEPIDFEIRCTNPRCDLNTVEWSETIPARDRSPQTPILPTFQIPNKVGIGHGLPIPAYTIDDQIYARCPSMMVSTVDKFARLGFEPRAASLFGYVTHYDSEWGYYREGVLPETGSIGTGQSYAVDRFAPPSLIIQDELHLIEGPLGTMVGLYENAVEVLTSRTRNGGIIRAKYVASTATIRQADSQVQALFDRELAQFPPPGISADDSFFAISREPHQLEGERPGRLYVGVCTPGRGAQTPIIRIWSAIMHEMARVRQARGSTDPESDQYWTLVGYFNAKKELAGAVGLFKADIPERLRILEGRTGGNARSPLNFIELSGRTASFEIPGKLDRLARFPENDVDSIFATAMFGTGVDVDRLGLMVVHGQPKTTGNYIQATGRVGRQRGGLVISFLRASRPRDLDHYEFFVGYHRSLHRHVEPVTVFPFSPRARERGLGPLAVSILRNAQEILGIPVSSDWAPEGRRRGDVIPQSGSRLMARRRHYADVGALIDFLESRARIQPQGRNPAPDVCRREISSWLERWASYASLYRDLVYYESTMTREARSTVVLGDPGHEGRIPAPVFRNAPQSLRDVEATTTFDDEA